MWLHRGRARQFGLAVGAVGLVVTPGALQAGPARDGEGAGGNEADYLYY